MNQHELNLEIEAFIHKNDGKGIDFFRPHLDYINKYEGSGGQGKNGATGEGVLYEFYTPDYVCDYMWKLAYHYGYNGGSVLEPSVATGRLLQGAPKNEARIGFEINPVTARICELNNMGAIVHRGYFETAFMKPDRFTTRVPVKELTWVKEYPFSLVIGNPPYGKYKNRYSSYFKNPSLPQIEQFFFYYGLKMLKPGGLLVYLVSSNFMRNGISYQNAKEEIFQIADFVDAYRLPPVFTYSQVPVDIIILKKK